jgi:hypothetical protein
MLGFLSRVGKGAVKAIGALKEPVRRLGQIGYNVGKFAVQNHATLAPLLHGVSVMSGNETAQKITGGLLALSKTASLRQNLNAGNERARAEMAKGGYGSFNHASGKMTSYK